MFDHFKNLFGKGPPAVDWAERVGRLMDDGRAVVKIIDSLVEQGPRHLLFSAFPGTMLPWVKSVKRGEILIWPYARGFRVLWVRQHQVENYEDARTYPSAEENFRAALYIAAHVGVRLGQARPPSAEYLDGFGPETRKFLSDLENTEAAG